MSRFLTAVLALALAGAWAWGAPAETSIRYSKQQVNGAGVHLVQVDLADQDLRLTPLLPNTRHEPLVLFADFLAVHRPLAQITGSFFNVTTGTPIGDIVINGKRVVCPTAPIGTALAVTAAGDVFMFDKRPPGAAPWARYASVLQGGVRLVANGEAACAMARQGFRDTYMNRKTVRVAVGITGKKKVALVAVLSEVTLQELAVIMQRIGCRDAMALDSGASTGFAYRGTTIIATRRKLSNVLAIMPRPAPKAR